MNHAEMRTDVTRCPAEGKAPGDRMRSAAGWEWRVSALRMLWMRAKFPYW